MNSTVVGLYDDHNTAQTVFSELKHDDIDSDQLHMVSHEDTDQANWDIDRDNWNNGQYDSEIVDRLTNLSVPGNDAEMYAEGVRRGGTLVVAHVDQDRADKVARVMNLHKPVDIHTRFANWQKRGFTSYDRTARPFTPEQVRQEREDIAQEEHIPEVEEDVNVGKQEVSKGGVRVHTHVTSKPIEKQVTLRDEHVDVERRNVDRPLTEADKPFQDRTIEFRETEEEPVVSKTAHVTGEVVVRKDIEERNETVRDTARHSEVEVEQIGAQNAGRGFDTYTNDFHTHCDTTYGKDSWNNYEPAYRWGYMAGGNERYRDRDFITAEPELQRDYEARNGNGTWDRVKGAVHHAYDRARA